VSKLRPSRLKTPKYTDGLLPSDRSGEVTPAEFPMANEFDAYREALVVETATIWPDELGAPDPEYRERIEAALHASPQEAAELTYERMHTGFSRVITVTADDLKRLGVVLPSSS